MFEPLEVPPELQHLLEKRELGKRRAAERRKRTCRRVMDLAPAAERHEADDLGNLARRERRSGKDRRRNRGRRLRSRRRTDGTQD